MKKYLFIILFLMFSINSYALNTEEFIKSTCSGFEKNEYFYYGFDCSWLEKNIYYINDEKVTKEKYDIEKNNYNTKWPICEETKNSKINEFPKDISVKCIKGKYWEYYYKWKIINYLEWRNLLIRLSIQSYSNNTNSNTEVQNQIKISEEKLQSYDSFINSIKDGTWNWINTYYVKWSDCNFWWSLIFNWSWYKNLICSDRKIQSLDYILDNKNVSYDDYMHAMYLNEKDAISKEIEYYKTQDSMWNTYTDISDNSWVLNKSKNQYFKQYILVKTNLKNLLSAEKINLLDAKLNTLKEKIKKEDIKKQKIIIEKLYNGLDKIKNKYKDQKWQNLIDYIKSYFEFQFFNL